MNLKTKRKFLKKTSSKSHRLAYSTTNSALGTRPASPTSQHLILNLQQKVSQLQARLIEAQNTIIQYDRQQLLVKDEQKEFLKLCHLKMSSLNKDSGKHLDTEAVDEKVSQERNALDTIWKKRYDDLKRLYEAKLNKYRNKETLCSKCKSFVANEKELQMKLKSFKFL